VTWQAPAALAALALVAGPVLVHLLTRRRARRVSFPGMRFEPAMTGAAVRIERPSDAALLALRVAAVAAAALAVAQPVWLSAARQRAWASRVTRAIVVDTSASVAPSIAAPLADRWREGAFASRRFESADVRDALQRAVAWLEAVSGRRDIAIVSDFQLGAIDAGDLSTIPAAIGIHLERAGAPSASRAAARWIDGWRDAAWTPLVSAAGGTQVTWRRGGGGLGSPVTVRAADAEMAAARRALAAARSWGITEAADRRVEIAFAGAAVETSTPPRTAWIAAAAMRLQGDALAAAVDPALVIGERDGVMIAATRVRGASPQAPAVARAVLDAAAPNLVDPETEPRAVDEATIASWVSGRGAPPAPPDVVPPDTSDGRWLWGLALAFVLLEGAVRRGRRDRALEEVHADAA